MNFIFKLLLILKTIKFKFYIPPKRDILIYDREGSNFLSECIPEISNWILDVRKESLNFFVLLNTILKGKFTYKEYLDTYISIVDPKIILTLIDNNPNFYLLKKKFKDKLIAFIQNGTRGEIGDVFGNTEPNSEFQVDLMFVHGEAIGKKYCSIICGESIAIGSFKNNLIPINTREINSKKTLLFISTYTIPPILDSIPIWVDKNGVATYWSQFYAAENLILPFLKDYCIRNQFQLQICGRLIQGKDVEEKYYSEYLSGCDWRFLERKSSYSNYIYIDKAHVIINIDSTLGYEALGREKKVAFFSIRGESLKNSATKFGWPGNFSDIGPFWTSSHCENMYKEVLDHLFSVSQIEYIKIISEYKSQLMNYDLDNKIFKKEIFNYLYNH
jgi:surface carbohydrate biosynthesis protein